MTTRILVGDVRDRLAELPDRSVHCVVTSPPYFGLRDYGTAQWDGGDPACDHSYFRGGNGPASALQVGSKGTQAYQYERDCKKCGAVRIDSQIGLEPTLADYIANLVAVFREVRRVMRDDATLWLNIGDSYVGSATSGGNGHTTSGLPVRLENMPSKRGHGLKPKDLMLVPARLAIALVDDGWYLRSDIIWAKRAPMPESVTDRPTSAHEHIFLLTKRPTYYYDQDAVREPNETERNVRTKAAEVWGQLARMTPNGNGERDWNNPAGRNMRNVWTLSPEPFPASHFAVYPTEIPRRAIKAGTSERGCCAACGAPWRRVQDSEKIIESLSPRYTGVSMRNDADDPRTRIIRQTTGWEPSCACGADVVPCRVLDPFSGSGTTGVVCVELSRDYIGIELNPDYAAMSQKRITETQPPLFQLAHVGA